MPSASRNCGWEYHKVGSTIYMYDLLYSHNTSGTTNHQQLHLIIGAGRVSPSCSGSGAGLKIVKSTRQLGIVGGPSAVLITHTFSQFASLVWEINEPLI